MSTKFIASCILFVAIALFVAYYYNQRATEEFSSHSAERSQDSTRLSEAMDNNNGQLATAEVDDEIDTVTSVEAIIKRAFGSNSAVAMDQALDELAFHEPEYAEWRRRDLPDFCNPVLIEYAGNESVRAGKEKFCAGFDRPPVERPRLEVKSREDPDDEDVDALVEYMAQSQERLSLNPEIRFSKEQEAAIEAAPESAREQVFTQLVRNARFPEEVFTLMTEVGYVTQWQFGQEFRQSMYPEADLLNAQQVALHLYACQRFGGCGRDQYWTLLFCTSFYSGRCRPGASLEDVLYQTTPPADFGLAMEILARL